MIYERRDVTAQVTSLESALAVPCPAGCVRQVNFTEAQAQIALDALRVVLDVYEYAAGEDDSVCDDLTDLLSEHGFYGGGEK